MTSVADAFTSIAGQPEALQALSFLAEDFASIEHLGPKRYAAFLGAPDDDVFRQDAVGVVQALLAAVRERGA